MKRTPEEIAAWEAGESAPTYPQLEKLAYNVYKRPVAVFFFDEPPEEEGPREVFRTLPDFVFDNLAPDSYYALRQAQSFQESVRELSGGVNAATPPIFRALHANPKLTGAKALADSARQHLGIDVDEQARWSGVDNALKRWREAVQEAGVYVFKRSFTQPDVVGFSLLDPEFPVIILNNGHAKSRQIFTLFHELAHLLIGVTDATLEASLSPPTEQNGYWAVERYCNSFAGHFLMPPDAFAIASGNKRVDIELLSDIAKHFLVSREVVARRFLDQGRISSRRYRELAETFNADYEKTRSKTSKSGGPTHYTTKAAYLGDAYLNLAFSAFHSGRTTYDQVAAHLNERPKNIPGLEEIWLRRTAGR